MEKMANMKDEEDKKVELEYQQMEQEVKTDIVRCQALGNDFVWEKDILFHCYSIQIKYTKPS